LLEDGAVRLPDSGRLIPHAAQRRSERTWMGMVSLLKDLDELLSLRTCIRGLPPSVRGGGSFIILSSWAFITELNRILQNDRNSTKDNLGFMIYRFMG
jgi:hypothetical protein